MAVILNMYENLKDTCVINFVDYWRRMSEQNGRHYAEDLFKHWNENVVRMTALIFTGDIKDKLRRLQWISRLSSWRPFCLEQRIHFCWMKNIDIFVWIWLGYVLEFPTSNHSIVCDFLIILVYYYGSELWVLWTFSHKWHPISFISPTMSPWRNINVWYPVTIFVWYLIWKPIHLDIETFPPSGNFIMFACMCLVALLMRPAAPLERREWLLREALNRQTRGISRLCWNYW